MPRIYVRPYFGYVEREESYTNQSMHKLMFEVAIFVERTYHIEQIMASDISKDVRELGIDPVEYPWHHQEGTKQKEILKFTQTRFGKFEVLQRLVASAKSGNVRDLTVLGKIIVYMRKHGVQKLIPTITKEEYEWLLMRLYNMYPMILKACIDAGVRLDIPNEIINKPDKVVLWGLQQPEYWGKDWRVHSLINPANSALRNESKTILNQNKNEIIDKIKSMVSRIPFNEKFDEPKVIIDISANQFSQPPDYMLYELDDLKMTDEQIETWEEYKTLRGSKKSYEITAKTLEETIKRAEQAIGGTQDKTKLAHLNSTIQLCLNNLEKIKTAVAPIMQKMKLLADKHGKLFNKLFDFKNEYVAVYAWAFINVENTEFSDTVINYFDEYLSTHYDQNTSPEVIVWKMPNFFSGGVALDPTIVNGLPKGVWIMYTILNKIFYPALVVVKITNEGIWLLKPKEDVVEAPIDNENQFISSIMKEIESIADKGIKSAGSYLNALRYGDKPEHKEFVQRRTIDTPQQKQLSTSEQQSVIDMLMGSTQLSQDETDQLMRQLREVEGTHQIAKKVGQQLIRRQPSESDVQDIVRGVSATEKLQKELEDELDIPLPTSDEPITQSQPAAPTQLQPVIRPQSPAQPPSRLQPLSPEEWEAQLAGMDDPETGFKLGPVKKKNEV